MSDEPARDLDTSTPTVEEAALYWQWGGHMWQAPERFDRMIAKIKADALREAAEAIALVVIPGSDEDDNLATAAAQGWLTGRANGIEREA